VPTTEWAADFDERDALPAAPRFSLPNSKKRVSWRRTMGQVRHVFTHFPLELSVYLAAIAVGTPAPRGMRWVALADIAGEALPTLMRKVVAHALDA
jgi:A/G-specific adenine glycosylase